MGKTRLTVLQRKVLEKMADGWELGWCGGNGPRAWLQDGGVGKGGKSLPVNIGSFCGLRARGLIEASHRSFPVTTYGMTHCGREALSDG